MAAKPRAARKNYGIVRSILPDFCLTPIGPLMVPVAYTIFADMSFSRGTVKNVKQKGQETFTMECHVAKCTNDELGTGGGIHSGVNLGTCRPATHAGMVLARRSFVVHHDSMFWMNCAGPTGVPNTVGKLVLVNVAGTEVNQWITEEDFRAAQKLFDEKRPGRPLNDADYQDAADRLKVDKNVIKAISEQESPMGGFLPSGQPTVLFEGHQFWRNYINNAVSALGSAATRAARAAARQVAEAQLQQWAGSYPGLIVTSQSQNQYFADDQREYTERLGTAIGLDRQSALMSTSYGRFQILGSNYHAAGFNSVEDFVTAMGTSEQAQLNAFVNFTQNSDPALLRAMQNHDWDTIAKRYNGPNALTPGADGKNYSDHIREKYEKLEKEDAEKAKAKGVHVEK